MNKQELERIILLPDILLCESIEKEFKKLISETKYTNNKNNKNLLTAYFELAERQWHTYKLLDLSLLQEIDSILITLWDSECLESTEIIIGIIGMLGLQKTYDMIKSSISQKLSEEIKQEILEAIEEFGDTITNPYSSLEPS